MAFLIKLTFIILERGKIWLRAGKIRKTVLRRNIFRFLKILGDTPFPFEELVVGISSYYSIYDLYMAKN